MTLVLLWLAVPLALSLLVIPSARAGSGVSRVIVAGFVLAALWQGVGTLDPADLRALGRASAEDAWFIAFAAGLGVAGAFLTTLPVLSASAMALALPLAIGLAASLTPAGWRGALAGLAVGSLPALAARVAAHAKRRIGLDPEPVLAPPEAIAALLATAAIAWRGPVGVSAGAAIGLAWYTWQFRGHGARWSRLPLVPGLVTLLAVAWAWLSITIAGDPIVPVRAFAATAPVSQAAEVLLALVALSIAVLMAAPWPLHRFPRSGVLLPAAVLVAASAREMAPTGVEHWLPLVTAIGVVSGVAAMALRRPVLAAASLVVLGSALPGAATFAASMALALGAAAVAIHGSHLRGATDARRLRVRLVVMGAAVAATIVLQGVLADEVTWAVLFALSAAGLALRFDAPAPDEPAPGPRHVATP